MIEMTTSSMRFAGWSNNQLNSVTQDLEGVKSACDYDKIKHEQKRFMQLIDKV